MGFLAAGSHDVLRVLSLGRTGVGLVLVSTDVNDREYRRVGILPMIKREWFKESDLQTLTLV